MKVLITYDFISTNRHWGKGFCQRLDFITKVLKYLEVDVTVDSCTFKRETLFDLVKSSFSNNNVEAINLNKLNPQALEYIKKYVSQWDVLIAYEISHQSKEILDYLSIRYIDIWVSPIRFCEDLMFEFYSNDKKINRQLTLYKKDKTSIFQRAQKIINQSKYFFDSSFKVEKNSALVIGQLFQDKAVLRDNRFLTLLDFYGEIEKMADNYSKIYFLKHPLMKEEDFSSIVERFKVIENFVYLENANVYKLLSQDEIVSLYAVSSSVLTEAHYFNKKIHYFYQPVIDERYTRIDKMYYQTSFWNKILNLNTKKEDIEYLVDDNYIRYKYDAFFAYKDYVEEKDELKNNRKKYNQFIHFYNFLENLPKNKKYILYGYGSIGKLILPILKNNIKAVIDKNIDVHTIDFEDKLFPVLKVDDLTTGDNVIISPFVYHEEIQMLLNQYECNIIRVNG